MAHIASSNLTRVCSSKFLGRLGLSVISKQQKPYDLNDYILPHTVVHFAINKHFTIHYEMKSSFLKNEILFLIFNVHL